MSFVLFLTSFAFYLAGLSGTVPTYRDSGDLIASIHALGIAHPPGYATYVLLGKLFVTLLPLGNVAYRVNVLSAVFAAGAVAMLATVLHQDHESNKWLAVLISALFATTPAVVALARVAEMYTMAAFFAAAIVFCLLKNDERSFCYAALLWGLGLAVHPTLIFLFPIFFVPKLRPFPRSSLLYFALGLLVFLYLPIRASQHPLINWGDPSSWRNFWRVVTRADYGGLKLHPEESVLAWSPGSVLAQLKYFFSSLKSEWGWGALALGIVGIGMGLHKNRTRRLAAGVLVSWILAGPLFFVLSNLPLNEATTPAILQPYLILNNVLWSFFIYFGALFFLSWQRWSMLAIFPLLVLTRSWSFPSQRHDFYAYDYARNVLRSLPPGAVLYDPDDPTHFSIQDIQLLEHRRQHVILLNFFRTRWGYEQIKRQWPDLLPPIPMTNAQELERAFWTYSIRVHPFYAELPQKFGTIPYRTEGLVYRAYPQGEGRAENLFSFYVMRGDYVTTHHPDFFTAHLISYYAAAQNNMGVDYVKVGNWTKAMEHYKKALEIEPDQRAAQTNLSAALQTMRKLL